jgi:hypothetical protein
LNKIAIIGGGPAGLSAAISAYESGGSVTVFERNDRIGKKILMTGNGKCNFSNLDGDISNFHSGNISLVKHVLKQFSVEDTIFFFTKHGLVIKNKNGYLYPASEQASTVLDILRLTIKNSDIELITGALITDITYEKKFFIVCNEKKYIFDKVILSCGGCACPKSGSDGKGIKLAEKLGHSVITPVPALVPLRCKEDFFKSVSGVRTDAVISLYVENSDLINERGELQLTDYGISGIPVFQLSRFASIALKEKKNVSASIDFLPDFTEDALLEMMTFRLPRSKKMTLEEFLIGILNKKLNMLFIKLSGLKPNTSVDDIDGEQLKKLFLSMKNLKLHISAANSFDNAQVSAGGVDCSDITETLESKIVPGLYFAGEILDIDGRCGGYNLQWAWSSGNVAGKAAAQL